MRALGLSLALLLAVATMAAAADENHRRVAEHYAPVVFQESRSTVLDFITRFDYDGDWKGDNNWRNAYLYDLHRSRVLRGDRVHEPLLHHLRLLSRARLHRASL